MKIPKAESNPQSQKPAGFVKNIVFEWNVRIPMRDGITLGATVYRPRTETRVPVILSMTPYIADSYHARGAYFAGCGDDEQPGFAFALVDCRGRGNSQGSFEPFVMDGRDAYDAVQWLAAQSWCDGQATMWGGSYAGFNQWMALKEAPPALRTIVPAAAAHAGIDFPFFKNIFHPYEIQWQTFVSGVTGNTTLFNDQQFWIDAFRELYLSGRPFRDLDTIAGNPSPVFQTWLDHPRVDDYWTRMWLTPEDYARIDRPILTITGHYDDDQPGALHYYREHMRHGTRAGKEQHFLMIGPWDHAGTRTPLLEFGGLKFGQASQIDLNRLHKEWYNWTLRGDPRPEFLQERIAYYVMGADEWKYAASLGAIPATPQCFYLSSENGKANDVFHSGTLEPQPVHSETHESYTYDPRDLRAAELEQKHLDAYLTDQRYALNLFGNGLVYHSAPFEGDTEITGWPRLVAWMALDAPDTDFVVTLAEILPDGQHTRLGQDWLRARYRTSLTQETLISPGEVLCYEFAGFPFFSRRIAKGSRLRLVISCPNTIFLEKNYNGGGVVAEESAVDAREVHVTLYHDAEHPSYLELPVVKVG